MFSLNRQIHPLCTVAVTLIVATHALAFNDSRQLDPEDRSGNWSLGAGYSWQDTVYAGEDARADFMPTFVYTGEKLFIDTTDFGWHLIDNDRWQLDAFGSYYIAGYNDHSFFSETGDLRPADDPLKGMERKNAFEAALELTRKTAFGRFGIELRHDVAGIHNGGDVRARWAKVYRNRGWQLEPWVEWQWMSAEKADYYFGVRDSEATDARPAFTLDETQSWAAGIALRYSPWDQHHLALNLAYREFASEITDSPIVTENAAPRAELTYRYELNRLRKGRDEGHKSGSRTDDFNFFSNNANPGSLRLAYGCTTNTKFIDIIGGGLDCDGNDTGLISVFLGRKISDDVFTLPVEVWLQAGVARRFENELQGDFFEGVVAFKALYRRFPWSKTVETRFGLAQGLSYVDSIPSLEKQKAAQKRRRTSHLLNYLDFSLDVSLGDVVRSERLSNLFFGFSVHHRSGVFASADIFGNAYGGTNVNTLYLEWEFD